MRTFLLGNNEETLAVVRAGGRRQALRIFQADVGGVMHHSCRVPILHGASPGGWTVQAYPARMLDGEVLRADDPIFTEES